MLSDMPLIDPDELQEAVRDIGGRVIAADDQARAMTDRELGERLLAGRWTTIEVLEAGRRLVAREPGPEEVEGG